MAEKVDLNTFFDFLEDDALELTGIKSAKYPDGKTYVIESPDAKTGLHLAALGDIMLRAGTGAEVSDAQVARLKLDDDEERELMDKVLGPVKDEMIGDGVKWVHLRGISKYAFIYFAVGKDQADLAARNGVLAGKEQPANRAARRAKKTTQSARPASSASSKKKAPAKGAAKASS